MRTLLRRILPALVFTLAVLALPVQSLAGDTSNASKITDPTTWAQYMHQVMGGASNTGLPGAGSIRGPAGIYAVVRLTDRIPDATKTAGVGTLAPCEPVPKAVDNALTTYFNYLLGGGSPALPLSGLMILAQWQDLSECDPGTNLESINPGSLRFNYLDDAFNAIEAWNKANPLSTPKTLQLVVTPGFNSPEWTTGEMTSCDDLFVHPHTSPPAGALSNCDYTSIFYRVENAPRIHWALPLPWSQTYKDKWRFFLTALNDHIGARQEFVSIAVAGPTASSAEIILPNGNPLPHNLNAGAEALKLPGMKNGISVYTAWNCLLGNFYGVSGTCNDSGYGAGSSYVNTNRAFIEEWAAAIDMYGQIFSSVTLVVTTGSGLPEFSNSNNAFKMAPPGFTPDCGTSSTTTMDCAAETAILAYFAGPPIGGPNAKATEEDALMSSGSGAARVKWLSEQTRSGPSVLKGSPALVSRMLGGLQFKKSFSEYPMDEAAGVSKPEQALLDVLENFFKGTVAASPFGASATDSNNGEIIRNAPINYLQIWEEDFIYAYGWQNCSAQQLMTPPKGRLPSPPGCKVEDMSKHTVTAPLLGGSKLTALELLDIANDMILTYTAEPAALPPTCCIEGYFPRGAFQGDPVCVSQAEQSQVQSDTAAAVSGNSYSFNYTVVPTIPYGVCKQPPKVLDPLQYRQAYMGDYVCVTNKQWSQVNHDNASFPSHVLAGPACPPSPPPLPLPGPH